MISQTFGNTLRGQAIGRPCLDRFLHWHVYLVRTLYGLGSDADAHDVVPVRVVAVLVYLVPQYSGNALR